MMKNTESVESREDKGPEKLTDWPNEPTAMQLGEDLQMAKPDHDVQVSKVEKWIAIRDAKNKGVRKDRRNASGKTRSTIQPKLVRKQAEWRYPALSEPFLSSDKTFQVKPTSWEDRNSASQNELVLNWQFRTKMNTVKFIDDFVRTVVDEGTAVVKVGWVRTTKVVMEEVPLWEYRMEQNPQSIEQLQMLIQQKMENPQGFQELPAEVQESVNYSMEKGVPAYAVQVGTETVEREKVVNNHPTAEMVNYQNFYLDPTCLGDVKKANFAVVSFETSKAELIKDGRYRNLDRVNWSSQTPLHQPEHSSRIDNSVQFSDDLRKRVVAHEYWGFYDVKGDDVLVPIVATWIGNVMIRMEENPFPDQKLPFVVVPYLPVKDSVTGEPDAELLEEHQDIMGAVMRGIVDLMGRSANGQTGYAKGALDPLNRAKFEKGEDYEFNPGQDPSATMYQHKYPEIPNSALTMLTMQNQEAESLSGVKAFSGGLSGEAYGQVASGIRGLLDASAKREMSILRRLAQGMQEIGSKFVAMNGVFLSEEEVIEVTNEEFVKVVRDDLIGEFNTIVDIATPEIEEAQAKDLGFMLQTLGNTVPWEITKLILSQIAKLKRMSALAKAIDKFEPKPDPLAEKMKELEMAKIEAQIAELQAQAALNQAKARLANSQADGKDLDFVEQETGTTHARDKDRIQAQADSQQQLAITNRVLDPMEPVGKPQQIADALRLQAIASSTV